MFTKGEAGDEKGDDAGTAPADSSHPDKIKVPVQAHTGEEDSYKGFADPEACPPPSCSSLSSLQKRSSLFLYYRKG